MRIFRIPLLLALVILVPFSLVRAAAPKSLPLVFVHKDMTMEFSPRTPNQMSSFYEARGFPKAMRDIIYQQCYITVGITNTSQKKIWMDLSNWKFTANGKPLKREHRDYWKQRWQDMDIPLRYQSTFRWTLIPETLDYLPGEREGGNLLLPFSKGKITLDATFATGEDKKGRPIHIHFDQLYCAEDAN